MYNAFLCMMHIFVVTKQSEILACVKIWKEGVPWRNRTYVQVLCTQNQPVILSSSLAYVLILLL